MKKNLTMSLFDLSGKTIILTGSAGLLGSEYSQILSRYGADVVLVDVDRKPNQLLEKSIRKNYHTNPMLLTLDISNQKNVKEMVNKVVKKYGKIDCLINNAFLNHARKKSKTRSISLESFPLEIWNQSLSSNLTSVFLCCKEVGRQMVKQKNGVIVNISSIYGILGADQRIYGKSSLNSPVSYGATKGAIVNLTHYLAAYWHRKNIRVNTLTLGGVQDASYQSKKFIKNYSHRTMLGRMAKKSDFNGALLFLVSDASSYMTGSNLIVDGGWSAW